jgi:hypothetical protein
MKIGDETDRDIVRKILRSASTEEFIKFPSSKASNGSFDSDASIRDKPVSDRDVLNYLSNSLSTLSLTGQQPGSSRGGDQSSADKDLRNFLSSSYSARFLQESSTGMSGKAIDPSRENLGTSRSFIHTDNSSNS